MRPLSLAQAAQMAGGTCRGTGCIKNVTNDSRLVTEGILFVALQGENVDGHQFVPDVLERGGYAMVRRSMTTGHVTKLTTLSRSAKLARAICILNYLLPAATVRPLPRTW